MSTTRGSIEICGYVCIHIIGPRQANLVLIAYASIRAVSPESPLLAHTSSESRGTFRQKARSLALLNGLACAAKICHDGVLEDTNSLDGAHMLTIICIRFVKGYNKTNKRPPTLSCPRASTSCRVYSDWRKVHSGWDRGSEYGICWHSNRGRAIEEVSGVP